MLCATIGAKRLMQLDGEGDGGFTMYGTSMMAPAIVLIRPHDQRPADPGHGNIIALGMDDPDKVDAFHARAIEPGGIDDGAPGYRGDPSPGYCFGCFRDPDGHQPAVFAIAPQG